MSLPDGQLVLGVALVDFNHVVGPRIEYFHGAIFEDESITNDLPFLALPDGAHMSAEDYSYFHLVKPGPNPTTIFGISCNQQIAAADLLVKGDDVTRSTVQKAVVVLASKPVFGPIREKLRVVTTALFAQRCVCILNSKRELTLVQRLFGLQHTRGVRVDAGAVAAGPADGERDVHGHEPAGAGALVPATDAGASEGADTAKAGRCIHP
jgi:hypothetical protein